MNKIFSRWARRTEAAEEIINGDRANEQEKQQLKNSLFEFNCIKYGSKISLIPICAILYKIKYFERPAPFFTKEITTIIAGIGYIFFSEYYASERLWINNKELYKKYANYSDSYYIDEGTLNKMKEMYKLKKLAGEDLNNIHGAKRQLNQIQGTKLYDDTIEQVQSNTNNLGNKK